MKNDFYPARFCPVHVLWTVHAAAPHRGGSLDCAFIWAFDMGAIDNKPDFSRPVRHRPALLWNGRAMLYTHSGLLSATRILLWLRNSAADLIIPVLVVAVCCGI